MAKNLTIKELKAGQTAKLVLIPVHVNQQLSQTKYLVSDKEDEAELELHPEVASTIQVGKFYKLVQPRLEGNTLVVDQPLLQTLPFKHREPSGPAEDSAHLMTFDEMANTPVGAVSPSFAAKVVFLSEKRSAAMSGTTRTVAVKDLKGRHYIFCAPLCFYQCFYCAQGAEESSKFSVI